MKRPMVKMLLLICCLQMHYQIESTSFITKIKGIGHSIAGWGVWHKSFWDHMAQGFGAPPSGYVYSFTVQNDTQYPVYVGIQECASVMGGVFPKAQGWSSTQIEPFQDHTVHNKEYYFEMRIDTSGDTPSNQLPYTHPGALYVQDCIELPKDKHSTTMNYFRSYIGKSLRDGVYAHELQAEYLGYADPANPKDKNATIDFVSSLTSLVISNSTLEDFFVGYSSNRNAQKLSKEECDVFFAPVQKRSFALFSPSKNNPLEIGTVGVFREDGGQAVKIFNFPQKIFKGKSYTVEIYQDEGARSLEIGLQGLMPGHYDVPTGVVRDITPVTGVFWYKSAQQAAQGKKAAASPFIDLPGQLWVVFMGENSAFTEQVKIGESLEFSFIRPAYGSKQWIYFVYVDTQDETVGEQFIQKFIDGAIGKDVIASYQTQSQKQMGLVKQAVQNVASQAKGQANQIVPEKLLIEAVQGSLKVHQGKIDDSSLGVSGYLLGSDTFLSQGVGASSVFYYQLSPSMKTVNTVPTSAVENLYAYTLGGGKPPKGIPNPSKVVGVAAKKSSMMEKKSKILNQPKGTKAKSRL